MGATAGALDDGRPRNECDRRGTAEGAGVNQYAVSKKHIERLVAAARHLTATAGRRDVDVDKLSSAVTRLLNASADIAKAMMKSEVK